MGELVATFALAQDNAFGQPLESQLRSCLLTVDLCEEAGLDRETRETAYWVALLRYLGCTGHAHEVSVVFGDEVAIRAQTLVHDAADPTVALGDAIAFAPRGCHPRRPSRSRRPFAKEPTIGRCTTSRPGARWATCWLAGSASTRACGTPWRSPSSGGTAPDTRTARREPRSRSRCASCSSPMTWRRSADVPHGYPGGLTGRESEVLRLAAIGLTTREIAERLFISPKTTDHHIQHVYAKIGVSTRAAAALWAMQNDIVR